MASLGLRCPGNSLLSNLNAKADHQQQQNPSNLGWRTSKVYSSLQATAPRPNNSQQPPKQQIVPVSLIPNLDIHLTSYVSDPPHPPEILDLGLCEEETSSATMEIFSETLDKWMRDSVTEIVKNIGKAPFLLHVFGSKKGTTTFEREKAMVEMWPYVKKRWDGGVESSTPDGIILVEELEDEKVEGREEDAERTSTRAWGVLIQGRGFNCTPACYILKTSRVCVSSIGFCTHFCLVRAKCFGPNTQVQLRNSWLL